MDPMSTLPNAATAAAAAAGLGAVSHYRLTRPLGRGAMGEVWVAEDTQLPRKVAVKLLAPHLALEPDAVARLLREAQAAASVDHPAIVTVYEAGIADGRPFLVMQLVEGETLAARLARGPLDLDEALDIARKVADALAEVHCLGIVHRDLKPANIVLSPRGPKILDFGVARLPSAPPLTGDGVVLGTPLTMSPEQVRGLPADNRSDLWAVGVILYEMLTGVSPFAGEQLISVGHRVLHEQPAPPSSHRPEVSADLDYLVMKLLRKDAAHRYARAEDLLADLDNCARGGAPVQKTVPRVAVTYFEVLSGDRDDFFLGAGLTDDLIVDLNRVTGVHVASREDVRAYRDRPVPARTLARELRVDYVLTGSVRRAGNRARISAQLVRASDGTTLWAERFDRTLDDLFAVQSEVSTRIVEALEVALRPGEREMLDRAPTRSAEAYTLYLQARHLLDGRSREDNLRAGELLERALLLDPEFALAHAALGEAWGDRGQAWWTDLEEASAAALPHALRALELEPDLVEAHIARGMVHRLRGESEQLLTAAERIIAMDPNCVKALVWTGWAYMVLGKPERAVLPWERLVELNHARQFFHVGALAMCYEMLNREDEHQRMQRRSLDDGMDFVQRHPRDWLARMWLAIALVRAGKMTEGLAQVEASLAGDPEDGRLRYNAACAFARAGLPERAIAELRAGIKNLRNYASDWVRRDPDLASLFGRADFVSLFGRA
jgi:non-specific serine/threonine protein kinase